MTFDAVPFVIDGTTTDGEVIRRAIGSLLNPAGGVITPGDLTVSQQATPNMSVRIGTGQIWVPGSSTPSQGMYYSRNGAAVTVGIAASNPSNPRIDQVIVQAQDAAYAGVAEQLQPAVLTGTPTAGAALTNLVGLASIPASSYLLAYVLVPAGATSIVNADIGNVQGAATLGPAVGVWQTYTPTWTGAISNPTVGNGTLVGSYVKSGNTCIFTIALTYGSTSLGGEGALSFSLPFTPAAATLADAQLTVASDGFFFPGIAPIVSGGNTVTPNFPNNQGAQHIFPLANADNTGAAGTGNPQIAGVYPLTTGSTVTISGTYRTT